MTAFESSVSQKIAPTTSQPMLEPDFGDDFYLLAISKLLHDQYFRLLDFYFHTLIQQRLAIQKHALKQRKIKAFKRHLYITLQIVPICTYLGGYPICLRNSNHCQ